MPSKPSDPDKPAEQSRESQKAAAKKRAPDVTPHVKTTQDRREARLAEALRDNLRRRKAATKKDD